MRENSKVILKYNVFGFFYVKNPYGTVEFCKKNILKKNRILGTIIIRKIVVIIGNRILIFLPFIALTYE